MRRRGRQGVPAFARFLPGLALCAGLQGCVVVGGSSRGGFFIWPGGLGLLLMIALFVFMLRRR